MSRMALCAAAWLRRGRAKASSLSCCHLSRSKPASRASRKFWSTTSHTSFTSSLASSALSAELPCAAGSRSAASCTTPSVQASICFTTSSSLSSPWLARSASLRHLCSEVSSMEAGSATVQPGPAVREIDRDMPIASRAEEKRCTATGSQSWGVAASANSLCKSSGTWAGRVAVCISSSSTATAVVVSPPSRSGTPLGPLVEGHVITDDPRDALMHVLRILGWMVAVAATAAAGRSCRLRVSSEGACRKLLPPLVLPALAAPADRLPPACELPIALMLMNLGT
mmetsp:Transcript_129/g.464  ORF Transcript_129/g.464 Transcript_129/m.464 type:complete len:283 (+) Transcript_129:1230-2078(+)